MELSERARELLRKTAMNYESHAKTLEKESGVTLDYAQRFITHQLAFLFAEAKMKLENDEVFLRGANERIRQQRETINQQQAEIERLRAVLATVNRIVANTMMTDGLRLYSIEETVNKALDQQQPEPPQESLEAQILKFLAACDKSVNYGSIYSSLERACFPHLGNLKYSGLIKCTPEGFYSITQEGRDYLASLEATKAE